MPDECVTERLLPLLQREKKGPVAARNGEMRGRHAPNQRRNSALPHLPQLRWGPFLSRPAGEDVMEQNLS
jgi:hypothetical protein